MRLEDYGKKLLTNVDPLSKELIKEKLTDYFNKNSDTRYHLLLGKEVSYYEVFEVDSTSKPVENLIDYLDSSFYINGENITPMNQILYLEEREDGSLEIWIDKVYFHLTPFDWGVEKL